MATISCSITGATSEAKLLKSGEAALPPGWKRIGGKPVSAKAWSDNYCLRTLAFPVSEIAAIGARTPAELFEGNDNPKLEAYRAFRELVRLSWRTATRASNWLLSELFSLDRNPWEVGAKGKQKLGKVPPVNHLPAIGRAKFPELESQSFYSLLQKVSARYREHRWQIHTGREALPSYRYPAPLPVPASVFKCEIVDGRVEVSIPFADVENGSGRIWYTVRLAGGAGFSRFVTSVKRVMAGEGLFGEVSFYERSAGGGTNDDRARDTPTANKKAKRIFCALTVWLPKDRNREADRLLKVTTGAGKLFTATVDGREMPWTLNENQVLGWIHARRRVNQRFSEDRKFERRRSRDEKANISSAQRESCDKFDRRIDDFLHKASAMLVGLAQRNRVSILEYDDTDHQFAQAFPWFKLKTLIEQKCNQVGVSFVHVGGSEETDQPEVLELPQTV